MEFILASSNAHKAEEFTELFAGSELKVVAASEKLEVIEDGHSFAENAFKKAKAYYDKYKEPIIADDSGLVVEALPEQLGIYSARFAPEFSEYEDKCKRLIELLEGKDRTAYFVCYLCLYISPQEIFNFEGRVMGQVGEELKGDHGFGYDPVFYPEKLEFKQSLAEVPEWKQAHSHRAKAAEAALNFFKERNCQ